MPKYKRRAVIVEAVQWFNLGDCPDLVDRYFQTDEICLCCGIDVSKHGRVRCSSQLVCPGNYIVRDYNKKTYAYTPEEFNEKYEQVEGDSAEILDEKLSADTFQRRIDPDGKINILDGIRKESDDDLRERMKKEGISRRLKWSLETGESWLETDEEIEERLKPITDQKKIDALQVENARLKQLYNSAIATVNKLQDEREGLLDRVKGALLGIEETDTDEQLARMREALERKP